MFGEQIIAVHAGQQENPTRLLQRSRQDMMVADARAITAEVDRHRWTRGTCRMSRQQDLISWKWAVIQLLKSPFSGQNIEIFLY